MNPVCINKIKTMIMKKYIIFLLFILYASSITAQQIENTIHKIDKDYHIKSKKEKETAWILLGGGTILFTGGVIAAQHSEEKGAEGIPYMFGGMLVSFSSIPFFISSTVNKHKARLELRKQSILSRPEVNKNIYQTFVSLKIDL